MISGSIIEGKTVNGIVDFGLEVGGDLVKHRIQCAGLFADRDHLQGHVREYTSGPHRKLQLLAGGDVIANAQDGIAVNSVAGGLSTGLERFDKRYTCGKGG